MVGRQVLAAKFPKRCIQITYVDHVAAGFADLYTVTHLERYFDEDIYPAEKTRDQGLKRETEHQRNETERDNRSVPIRKDQREDDEYGGKTDEKVEYSPEIISCGPIAKPGYRVNADDLCEREQQRYSKAAKTYLLQNWDDG